MVISHSKVPLYQRPCVFVLWGVLAVLDRNSKEDLDLMTPANTCRSSKSIRGARLFKKYTRKELLGVPGYLGPQKKWHLFIDNGRWKMIENDGQLRQSR